ncbi:MAG: endonuclease/exonuclease/phosphatase family protein [Deltaproteobacteria bacterium]|nr:endonuclease/exonuclease/phosphatase family protein [Deltaproteobacteria bacterium]
MSALDALGLRLYGSAMPRRRPRSRRAVSLGLLAAAAAAPLLVACSRGAAEAPETRVRIDGSLSEWPAEASLLADDRNLYFRLRLPEEVTLQGAPYTVALLVDADGDAATGGGLETVDGLAHDGAELAIEFSPPKGASAEGERAPGVAALLLTAPGGGKRPRRIAHDALDLVFSPTHSAKEFEGRIARRTGEPELAAALVDGSVRARVAAFGTDGRLLWSSPPATVELPPLGEEAPLRASIPPRRADAVRVVSWNVLFASPKRKPEPFSRILRALDPEVALVQEWEKASADDLATWFDEHVSKGWHAITSAGWGVAVIARGGVRRVGPERLERPREAPADTFRPDAFVRLAAAIVETRLGPLVAGSMHLKCCGAAGGREDRARIAEIETIHRALTDALGASAPALRVFGGDLNLVGSGTPLENLRRGLASGGGDLAIADTAPLGDVAYYTWRGARSPFTPGRLDFLIYGGGEPAAAFALDTRRLDEDALAAARLDANDSSASDHLVLVLDLVPR